MTAPSPTPAQEPALKPEEQFRLKAYAYTELLAVAKDADRPAIERARSALRTPVPPAAAPVAGDYVMVPRKPTMAMLNAAIDTDPFKLGEIGRLGFRCSPQTMFERCYIAMLAAAPVAGDRETAGVEHSGHAECVWSSDCPACQQEGLLAYADRRGQELYPARLATPPSGGGDHAGGEVEKKPRNLHDLALGLIDRRRATAAPASAPDASPVWVAIGYLEAMQQPVEQEIALHLREYLAASPKAQGADVGLAEALEYAKRQIKLLSERTTERIREAGGNCDPAEPDLRPHPRAHRSPRRQPHGSEGGGVVNCADLLLDTEHFFWGRVQADPNSGCWLWDGHCGRGGYGRLKYKNVKMTATRLALALVGRPVPDALLALHTCDTPTCVNPAHLYAGSRKQNSGDAIRRGRTWKGNGGPDHPHLSDNDVTEVRQMLLTTSISEVARQYSIDRKAVKWIRDGSKRGLFPAQPTTPKEPRA